MKNRERNRVAKYLRCKGKRIQRKTYKTETALSEMTNNSDYSSKEDAEKAKIKQK